MAFGGEGPTAEGVVFSAAAGAVGGSGSGFGAGLADDLVSTGQKSADEVASFAAQTATVAIDTAYEQVEELNGK